MNTKLNIAPPSQSELALLENAIPHIEQFIENRECYIRTLEETIEVLRAEHDAHAIADTVVKTSFDRIDTVQKLFHAVSAALEPGEILSKLVELTHTFIPVIEGGIFQVDSSCIKTVPFHPPVSDRLRNAAQQHLEEGIIDWVLREKKTVILPDFDTASRREDEQSFVIIPLVLQNEILGLYFIRTDKSQEEISHQDLQILSILANTAAITLENYRNKCELKKSNVDGKFSQEQMIVTEKLAAVGELAGGIAHEINNPLQILLGHVQLLQFGKDIPRRTEIIKDQVNRIVQITKRLVEFSRYVPDNFDMEPVSVNSAIEQILTLIMYQFRSNEIEIELKLDSAIPAIHGNMIYLQQVLLNLFLNAREAIGKIGKMTVETFTDSEKIYVRVIDTGCGISSEHMEHIFEPFFTTKGLGKGTGLGLPVSHGIVKKHGGDLTVKSEIGIGSTFTVILPVRKVSG